MSKPQSNGLLLQNLKWKAVINGRKSLNGARYSATITGDVVECAPDATIYEFVENLAHHLEEHNKEMALPDSLQITIAPAPSKENTQSQKVTA